jgi:hypothetical protein
MQAKACDHRWAIHTGMGGNWLLECLRCKMLEWVDKTAWLLAGRRYPPYVSELPLSRARRMGRLRAERR